MKPCSRYFDRNHNELNLIRIYLRTSEFELNVLIEILTENAGTDDKYLAISCF